MSSLYSFVTFLVCGALQSCLSMSYCLIMIWAREESRIYFFILFYNTV